MQPDDLTEDASGGLRSVGERAWAFVPAPLPPPGYLTPRVASILAEAERALGALGGLGRNMANPHLLIRPFLRREAVLSSRIEGTRSEDQDLLLFEIEPTTPPEADVEEVANYVKAMEHGLRRAPDLPISKRLIRELHERLMSGVRGEDRAPGEFRRVNVWLGGTSLEDARYVPPPPGELLPALEAWERFLNEDRDVPTLVRIAMGHYQFEAIHPFLDGNGRVGRLLITLALCVEQILPQPLLYPSAYFERNREAYYDHLLAVSTKGQWGEWLCFFLEGLRTQAVDAQERIARLQQLLADYRARFQTARSSALTLKLIDALFETPMIDFHRAKAALGAKDPTVYKHINALVDSGILAEITGKERNRIWLAREILAAIRDPLE